MGMVSFRLNAGEERAVRERVGQPSGPLGSAIKRYLLPESGVRVEVAPAAGAWSEAERVKAGVRALEKIDRGEPISDAEAVLAARVPFAERPGFVEREVSRAQARRELSRE